jgi:peroxiredoxin
MQCLRPAADAARSALQHLSLLGLVVLAVSVDDEPATAEQYARAHAASFPLLLDTAKAVSRAYAIDRLPSTVLIDRSGVIRYWHGG